MRNSRKLLYQVLNGKASIEDAAPALKQAIMQESRPCIVFKELDGSYSLGDRNNFALSNLAKGFTEAQFKEKTKGAHVIMIEWKV